MEESIELIIRKKNKLIPIAIEMPSLKSRSCAPAIPAVRKEEAEKGARIESNIFSTELAFKSIEFKV
jgi:hypothetical protein